MKKLLLASLLLILTLQVQAQFFSHWERAYTYPTYKSALVFSNPLSGSTKYGGGVERRIGNFSTMLGYYRYTGAYPGEMMDYEMRLYTRKVFRHATKRKWYYQNFYYVRPFIGIAAFNSEKLEFMGYNQTQYYYEAGKFYGWYEKAYYGTSVGWGRRYFTKYFFGAFRVGARAASFSIDPIEPEARQYYRLFYSTGPGSIFELNFQFGFQLPF